MTCLCLQPVIDKTHIYIFQLGCAAYAAKSMLYIMLSRNRLYSGISSCYIYVQIKDPNKNHDIYNYK